MPFAQVIFRICNHIKPNGGREIAAAFKIQQKYGIKKTNEQKKLHNEHSTLCFLAMLTCLVLFINIINTNKIITNIGDFLVASEITAHHQLAYDDVHILRARFFLSFFIYRYLSLSVFFIRCIICAVRCEKLFKRNFCHRTRPVLSLLLYLN